MTTVRQRVELSARDREILRDVVHTYLLSGEPVSSRAVARHERHGLSAASIRNVMADLEDLGLLEQPHTSAGRVPSRVGLHYYIASLMEAQQPGPAERQAIEGELSGAASGTPGLIETASQLLSRLSGQIGIVVTPVFGETVLEAVDFVPLSGRRVLCVVVSRSGFVENKLIETDEELAREELVRISNYLTGTFRGQTLRSVRERLLRGMGEERDEMDRLLGRAIALARRGLEAGGGQELRIEGTSSLLAGSQADVERVRRLLEAFAERQRLVGLLNQCLDGNGVRVVIGEDDELTSDLGLTLVARPYGAGERARGTLGILGPARMPYERIIPLVDFLGESLGRALEESAAR